jgi:hypothetical protein
VLITACFTARDCACVEEVMKRLGLGIVVAISLALPAFGQGVDPLIGTWKFNVEKSTLSTGQLPKSMILTVVSEGQDIVNTNDGVDAQGQSFKIVFRHIYDGQPHPTTGSPNYDSTTFHRIGNTINAVRFKNGKLVEVAQMIIDPGKTYTGRTEGVAASGQPYHYVYVFDRQ